MSDAPPEEDRPRLRDDLVLRQIDDDLVVYDPIRDTTTLLNPSATAILGMCDGDRTRGQIEGALVETFSIEPEVAARDVGKLVDELRAKGLIDPLPPRPTA